ncbi:MAG: NAD(P)/FAD-dependent oxidoreductase [Ekhidna sp.]|uniref:NAD(P)/FAD-dependent oxidoreductase n=1 Tax=Ekhidna sp. TaxID=2608089 RepID=UPI0032EF2121
MKDVIVIGGGLAGLINAILLNREGLSVQLFEEKRYPFHRVCGEYISNEVIPFLKKHQLYPEELEPVPINKFQLSSISGKSLHMPLDLGGFGISRHALDEWLVKIAMREGVDVVHDRVTQVNFLSDSFELQSNSGTLHQARLVIGAFGKRSFLDKNLSRNFIQKRSPYVGVKYHIRTDVVANDVIALHNFHGGYCGVSRIENDKFNLCYLSHRSNLKKHKSIEAMEAEVLRKNPQLKDILNNAESLFDKPEVINEITFEKKEPIFNHILMSGDSAGMITPLCGNGMAMAIHSAKILSELITLNLRNGFDRSQLEKEYENQWNKHFAKRLWAGRHIQRLFGASFTSEVAVSMGKGSGIFAKFLMKQTHGSPFS